MIYVLFDGKCAFCTSIVHAISRYAKRGETITYIDLRTPESRSLLHDRGIKYASLFTIYFIQGDVVLNKSRAVLKLLCFTRFKFIALLLLKLPRKLSDNVYDFIAKNRYRISALFFNNKPEGLRAKWK